MAWRSALSSADLCHVCWPFRGQARSHRHCAVPVGAGSPAKRPLKVDAGATHPPMPLYGAARRLPIVGCRYQCWRCR
ncbi:hypothetical protein E8E68_02065 [Pseudomonas sp. BN607]|nr:hypothetical protein [Pseudomonas sp. BN607]